MRLYPVEFSAALSALTAAAEVVALRDRVQQALALIGISKTYFLAPLTLDPRVGRVVTNAGFPEAWAQRYTASLYRLDPLPPVALTTAGAFFWPSDNAEERLDARQRRYLALAVRFGMGRMIGCACYGPHGRSGFLGAAWPLERLPEADELHWVQAVTQLSFQQYCRIHQQQAAYPALSARELEVLGWMCEGKSNPVIAQIVGVAPSSVDVYVRRIFAKLNVTDRTAACLRGYSLGYTVSGDYRQLVEGLAEQGLAGGDAEISFTPPR